MWVSDLRASYATRSGQSVRAVDGVSLAIRPGEVVGIAGESGSGKSTLASVLALTATSALQVEGGELGFDDRSLGQVDLARVPHGWRGKEVALLPQRAMNSLNPTARIGDIAFDVIRAHEPKTRRAEALDRARQRLELLSLPPRVVESYPHQLSGGMRQRVVAVVSTLLNPRVLIADEPSSALDVSSQKALVRLMRDLLDQGFITRVVFITHDLPLLSNIADRIAVMYAGQIVEVGPTAQIVERPEHPYTRALIGATLDPDPKVRRHRLEGLPGAPPDLRNPPNACRFHPRCRHAMQVCARQDPPRVGGEERFAACWWVLQQREPDALKGAASEPLRASHPPA